MRKIMTEETTVADEAKHQAKFTIGELETSLENHEAFLGAVVGLECVGDFTVATYEPPRPPVKSLALLPMIGDQAPPTPNGAELLFKGEAFVLRQKMPIAVYRVTDPITP